MGYTFRINLEYGGGSIGVQFTGDEYPDNFKEIVEKARPETKDALYEIGDVHNWRSSFETARDYSPPGKSVEPEVGTLEVDEDGEFEVQLSIESVDDVEWM